MARLYMLLFLVEVALAVCALISCLSTEEHEIRALPRIVWVLIILFFPLIGSIAWFAAGRPVQTGRPSQTWRAGGGFPERERPRQIAPDDDPEFLRSLAARESEKDRELLGKWEADLRRRENELRRGERRDALREDDRPEG
jgi:hypothetical protein